MAGAQRRIELGEVLIKLRGEELRVLLLAAQPEQIDLAVGAQQLAGADVAVSKQDTRPDQDALRAIVLPEDERAPREPVGRQRVAVLVLVLRVALLRDLEEMLRELKLAVEQVRVGDEEQ